LTPLRFFYSIIYSVLDSNYNQLQTRTPLDSSNNIINAQSSSQNVCRKCIFPKPVRAHHCSICARCILNQDHHCPWINNCVGHLNHRYFFQFCFFLTLGSFYVATLGFKEFQHYLFGRKVFSYLDLVFGRNINEVDVLSNVPNPSTSYTFLFLFIVAVTACLVLFGFTLWHFWLISRSETTIEFHTNSTERKRLKETNEIFINRFDLGFILNWKMFLGLNKWHEVFYKNFLPSAHRPFCDGVNWPIRNLTKSVDEKKKSTMFNV
jgi:palmitoyltransferase